MRMPLRKYSLFAILAACIPLSAAEVCNEKVASPQSKYIGTFTWQGQTLTVGSTSRGATRTASGNFQATFQVSPTGSSSGTDWLGLGNGAVDDLGNKLKKRQTSDSLQCQSNQVCLNNDSEIPFCVDERTGGWFGATGYEGNAVSGDYTAPDGQKGNIFQGPCPGSLYEESGDGCAIVPISERVEEASLSLISSTPTMASTSTPTSTSNAAAATEPSRKEIFALVMVSFAVVFIQDMD